MVDFISVMVEFKRADKFSDGEVQFPHNDIVEFCKVHFKFFLPRECIKVFILNRKFRLALQFLTDPEVPITFDLDFFTFAIEADAYDICFYLRYRFEDQIFANAQKAIEAHVQSYQNTARFLKAKLHLSKSLLPIFNFSSVKKFLSEMQYKIFDPTLENNMFSHSGNPIITMVLLYELLSLIAKKFFSLSYTCRQLMDQVKTLLMELIEQIDDENFLTTALQDRDYIGRDVLAIAVELELLDMIQIPKVEAVIKRIWNSDYDTSGSFFEMSTTYQIVNQSAASLIDIEETNRAWKPRNIEGLP